MPSKTRTNIVYVIGFPSETSEQEIRDFVTQKISEAGVEEQQLTVDNGKCSFTVRYVSDRAKLLKLYKYVDFNGKIVHFTDKDAFLFNRALVINGLNDNDYKKLDDFITNAWDIWIVNDIVASEEGYEAIVYFYSIDAANKCLNELKEYNGQSVNVRHYNISGKIKDIAKEENYFKKSKEMIMEMYNEILHHTYIDLPAYD